MCKETTFSKEDEEKIKAAVQAAQEQQKREQLEAEIRNRILDAQRKQPGYAGY